MGKLLQKLVHGIVPSWLTKVKSSAESSPKKLLPLLRAGGTHTSHKPPSSSSPPPSNTPVPPTAVDKSSTQSSSIAIPPAPLTDESNTQQDDSRSIAIPPSSSSVQRQESETVFGDSRRQHEECHVPEDVKVFNHQQFQDMALEDDIFARSDRHNFKLAAEQYVRSSEESLKMQAGVLQQYIEEHIHHSQDGVGVDQEVIQYDSGYQGKAYQDMLGLKRKGRSTKSKEEEEEEEEEEAKEGEGEGGGARGDDMKKWAWKRRKGEKGVMSCELPESICSMVGNGRAVVKQSAEPHLALWESMVEMIVGNGLWELGNLEFLLYCYLSLNEPHLHPIIQSSFLQVLKDLERIS